METDNSGDPPGVAVLASMWLDGADDIARARQLVADAAAGIGLPPDGVDRLTVALSEVATNAVVHGGGAARIRVTGGRGEVAVEVRDRGSGMPPPSVAVPVPPGRLSGRGLWLAGQLCDGVDIRPSDTGTTVRLTMRL
jgi:anti-sigma regulatory factor (Ser/Thr protein kinase)